MKTSFQRKQLRNIRRVKYQLCRNIVDIGDDSCRHVAPLGRALRATPYLMSQSINAEEWLHRKRTRGTRRRPPLIEASSLRQWSWDRSKIPRGASLARDHGRCMRATTGVTPQHTDVPPLRSLDGSSRRRTLLLAATSFAVACPSRWRDPQQKICTLPVQPARACTTTAQKLTEEREEHLALGARLVQRKLDVQRIVREPLGDHQIPGVGIRVLRRTRITIVGPRADLLLLDSRGAKQPDHARSSLGSLVPALFAGDGSSSP